MFNCALHPRVYCIDKQGKTCVLCVEAERRSENDHVKGKRREREAEVAAALAARADTFAAARGRWGDKLPTVNKLARTAANKAQQASKMGNAKNMGDSKAEKGWKGMAEAKLKAEKDKSKANPKLRIQRGR